MMDNFYNSKQRYCPNPVGTAVVLDDGKTSFFRRLAFWIQEWSLSPNLTLTAQTSSTTL